MMVENLLGAVTDVLPGSAAGSLARALGGVAEGEPGGTPGVNTVLDGGVAGVLIAGYLVVFAAASVLLANRRDLVG